MGCMLSICVMANDRQWPEIEDNYYRTANNWPEPVPEIARDARSPFGKSSLPACGGPSAGMDACWASS